MSGIGPRADTDGIGRIRQAAIEIAAHYAAAHDLAQERARIVNRLRSAGMGLGKIAEQLGVTKARVQQISKADA